MVIKKNLLVSFNRSVLIFRNFNSQEELSEEIDYFVSMPMPGGWIYRGFLPFLKLFKISNLLIFRNFQKSLEELSWAGWAKRSITLYLWQCLEAESIEVFCHYLEAVHENFPARAWNCITTTFGPMRNVIRDEPCIYRLRSRQNWLMLTFIVCDQIE